MTTKLSKVVNVTKRLQPLKLHDLHVGHITTPNLRVNNFMGKKNLSFYTALRKIYQNSGQRKTIFWHILRSVNPLSANPTKWSNTLKQFAGKLPTNCLLMFGHFVKLVLKVLRVQRFSLAHLWMLILLDNMINFKQDLKQKASLHKNWSFKLRISKVITKKLQFYY